MREREIINEYYLTCTFTLTRWHIPHHLTKLVAKLEWKALRSIQIYIIITKYAFVAVDVMAAISSINQAEK